ncbi:MAG: formate dehydrogenase subunit alpha [Burkholderiales bacterium]|nr:formate dehydrogenase subunit alpha [Burkholderiales bacterium]MDE2565351.1 formate dehydrogenase subunit alpha [Burkholderiales bacterium]
MSDLSDARDLGDAGAAPEIRFVLDGREVGARPGETLLAVADREGVSIPRLCARDGLAAVGNCRSCMVEIEGERVLAASCCRQPQPGMQVHSASARARKAQQLVLELLQADLPETPYTRHNEVDHWAERLEVGKPRFAPRPAVAPDLSHAGIAVNLDACIQCTRCLRACRDAQGNDVIGLAWRGGQAKIVFDMDDAMGASSCVGCGECVQACPTGALAPAGGAALAVPDRSVDSLCPYCGVGCQLTYHVKDEQILYVEGRDGPANHGRLCVKGRYGWDYVRHPQRLTKPLIRRAEVPKGTPVDPARPLDAFREASWDEALALAGGTLARIRDTQGPQALAGFGSAKGSNEEAYLFQKLVRLGFGSNNVDHCTRLCHASSVAALLEGIGSGAVSNPVMDVLRAEVVIVIGANPTVNHPVAATWIKNAVAQGTRLVVMDPRRSELARIAHRTLLFQPDTDVALLNAMMHTIVEEGLADAGFIAQRTEGYAALVENVRGYSPEAMAPICGIPAPAIREVARLYATSRASMILWGMGVSQHVHGTDNARCLIALALMTGQIGRPGTGLHPLRGQNNVQGASDAGLIPMMYPDYQHVDDDEVRERFARAWGVPAERLDRRPGLTVVEVMRAIDAGRVRGMYILGENPAMSDPDADHARRALAALEMLVVQDLFLTETAALADVVLPASAFAEKTGSFTNTDRTVQLARQVLAPPGDARPDLWIVIEMARRLGLDWSPYGDAAGTAPGQAEAAVARVYEEMRGTMPSIAGISWARLQAEQAVTYPCAAEGEPGEPVVFVQRFPTASGRARFVPADLIPAAERPDAEYPMVLITGRQLEHWHTGSMTRRSGVLDAIEPDPVAMLHPLDLAALGVAPGQPLTLHSRRGQVTLYARADDSSPRGTVFVAFCWFEAAINKLTNPALDPVAKIPEFKYCAVRVVAGEAAGGWPGRDTLAA